MGGKWPNSCCFVGCCFFSKRKLKAPVVQYAMKTGIIRDYSSLKYTTLKLSNPAPK